MLIDYFIVLVVVLVSGTNVDSTGISGCKKKKRRIMYFVTFYWLPHRAIYINEEYTAFR